jgi:hypothetical protein
VPARTPIIYTMLPRVQGGSHECFQRGSTRSVDLHELPIFSSFQSNLVARGLAGWLRNEAMQLP